MDELVRWLGEQLDEDERIAQASEGGAYWKVAEQASCECCSNVRTSEDVLICTPDDRDAPHIAEHDPGRVLREIDAKRKILIAFAAASGEAVSRAVGVDAQDGLITGLVEAVQHLATVYADRPGYREEWRP